MADPQSILALKQALRRLPGVGPRSAQRMAYHLLERVSVGGMAEVFKAIEYGADGFEREVAVKRILPHVAEDEEFITMFKDEAHIAVSHWGYGVEILSADPLRKLSGMDVEAASRTAVDGDVLYALSFEGSITAYDISRPEAPGELWTLEGFGSPRELVLTDDYAYLADSDQGLITLERTASGPMT